MPKRRVSRVDLDFELRGNFQKGKALLHKLEIEGLLPVTKKA